MAWSALLPLLLPLITGGLGAASRGLQKDPTLEKFDTLSPEQSAFQKQILQLLSGQGGQMGGPFGSLQKLLSDDPAAFKDFEAPFKRQFEEQTVPGLAERFSGAGAGAQKSSAFGQALSSAGAGLSENLANLRGGLKMNALNQLMSLIAPAMQPSFGYQEKQQRSPWADIFGGFGSGIAKSAGKLMPGMAKKYWGIG